MLHLFQTEEILHMYNEKMPVGPNTVGPICKNIVKDLGFSDWDK
jgi:hypothetical protein